MQRERKPIYLDHHATTPVDPRVVEAMLPFFTTHFGNPSGTETASGRKAAEAVQIARAQVASLLNVEPAEIVFTSGATEANNLAILGTVEALQTRTPRRKIVTTPIEHKSVLQTCKGLAHRGFEIVMIPVTSTGRIDLKAAESMIDKDTLLVSFQTASNEIGTIQPVAELVEHTHGQGALFHSDAAQAVGKIPIDASAIGIDLLSLSAHKFYGPKGVGALYIRNGPRFFPIRNRQFGGGQEQGLRSGTINVPGVVGLGMGAEMALEQLHSENRRVKKIRDSFEAAVLRLWPKARRNGDLLNRLPNNSSITFPGVDAQALVAQVPELELSTGSACTAGTIEPSHVLLAIGMSRRDSRSTIRVGFGKANGNNDAGEAASFLFQALSRLESANRRGSQ